VNGFYRLLIGLAAIMGACGVMLAAATAHLPDASRLAAASSMLLFHAPAVLATVALADRAIIQARIGVRQVAFDSAQGPRLTPAQAHRDALERATQPDEIVTPVLESSVTRACSPPSYPLASSGPGDWSRTGAGRRTRAGKTAPARLVPPGADEAPVPRGPESWVHQTVTGRFPIRVDQVTAVGGSR